MPVTPIFNKFIQTPIQSNVDEPVRLITQFCQSFKLPDEKQNHAYFDEQLTKRIASYKNAGIKPVIDMLKKADSEKDITAGLFLLNRLIDAGAKNVGDTYPIISKFNYSKSHNVQVMLSGIYRKTLVPDGFGPLVTMFLHNAQNPVQIPFDPNEEIGGAILEYLKNNAAINNYTK